jgi:mannose-6-phosphate isomerase-like protein (cupin superfamily)
VPGPAVPPDLAPPAPAPSGGTPPDAAPPTVVNIDQVAPIIRHPEGGGTDRPLLTAASAGTEHVFMGYCTYEPGKGSQWHSHVEEDVFFIVSGTGHIYYEKDGEQHSLALRPGDAVFSGYLPNYVRNTGTETLVMVYAISPKGRYEP